MPLNLGKGFPSEYVENVNFTSTGGDYEFGFNANYVRLRNRSAKSVYITLRSTTGATTSGHEIGSSEDVFFRDADIAGMSFVATSSGGFLTIGAWGS